MSRWYGHSHVLAVALGLFLSFPIDAAWYDTYDFDSQGVVAYWPFDGDSQDKSGNGNTGTWSAGGFAPGILGSGYALAPGVFYTVASSSTLFHFQKFTVSAWFKPNGVQNSSGEALAGAGSDFPGLRHPKYGLWVASDFFGPALANGTVQLAPEGFPPPVPGFSNQWHHAAVVWDGTRIDLYVDGNPVFGGPAFASSVTVTPGEPFYINKHDFASSTSSRLNGVVDDVIVFDRALTPFEILALGRDDDHDDIADFWGIQSREITLLSPSAGTTFEEAKMSISSVRGCDPDPIGWQWSLPGGFWLRQDANGIETWVPDATNRHTASLTAMWLTTGSKRVEVRNESCPELTAKVEIALSSNQPGGAELFGHFDPTLPTVVLVHGLLGLRDTPQSIWSCIGPDCQFRRATGALVDSYLHRAGRRANVLQFFWPDALQGGLREIDYLRASVRTFDAGVSLAELLLAQIADKSEFASPVLLIGHSLGTVVSSFAAHRLISELPGLSELELVALDRPHHIRKLLSSNLSLSAQEFQARYGFDENFFELVLGGARRPNLDLRLENYYSLDGLGVGDVAHGPVYNHDRPRTPPVLGGSLPSGRRPGLVDPHRVGSRFFSDENDDSFGFDNNHSGVQQWYRWTTGPSELAAAAGKSERCNGFTLEDSRLGTSLNPCGQAWFWSFLAHPSFFPGINGRDMRFERRQINLDAIEDHGCGFAPDGFFRCLENSSPFSRAIANIPSDTAGISFDFRFSAAGADDWAELSLDGDVIWSIRAETVGPSDFFLSTRVPLGGLTGLRTLEVRLNGRHEPGTLFEVGKFEGVAADVNELPVADAGPDLFAEAGDGCKGLLALDGTKSFDPDGEIVLYQWITTAGDLVSTPKATVSLPPGDHLLQLIVTDDRGNATDSHLTATVTDNTGPQIDLIVVNPGELWPPNHKMIPVSIDMTTSDFCSASPTCKITRVSDNESNDTSDWRLTSELGLELRAERWGSGSGRSYLINVECDDERGNRTTGEATVRVPHDRGSKLD